MKKKILLAVVLIVILAGAGFGYAYFATDMFKSGKELFFSYLLSDDLTQNLKDEIINEYIEKQKTTAFTNKGEISLNLSGDISEEESTEILNKSKLTFEGKVDNNKKLAEQSFTFDMSQGFNIPFKIKRDGETFGIQSDFLDSKYIAIKNENLKALAKRFDMDSEEIPDKIELTNSTFTDDELKTLQERYMKIFYDNTTDDMFTKTKADGQTKIELSMPADKFLSVIEQILSTAKNDEILLSKIPDETLVKEIQDEIDNLIEDCKDIETTDADKFNVVLYTKSNKLVKCELIVADETETITLLTVENVDNKLVIKAYDEDNTAIEVSIAKEQNGNDISYIISMSFDSDEEGKVTFNITMKYGNISELDNVEENMVIDMLYDEGTDRYSEESEIKINLTNLVTFAPDTEIENLNSDNATILNDATDDEIQNLLLSIYKNLGLM